MPIRQIETSSCRHGASIMGSHMLRRILLVTTCLAFAAAGIGCGGAPPDRDSAIADFERTVGTRTSVNCDTPEVVSTFTKAERLREYGLRATCTVVETGRREDRYYRVEYANAVGDWKLTALREITGRQAELIDSREPTEPPRLRHEDPKDVLVPIGGILIPVVIGVALFVFTTWVLRSRGGRTRVPPRRMKIEPSQTRPPKPR